ncbi:hypothetical protein SK128_011836 [Halocaridina rubra]|uniref:C2 domain-containing protein n=1 Tax=Halocaridina rubra TaxID=373956 RepID=A0AAN9A4H4_HALRR
MWQPTHIQVTVQRARNLNCKGKNDTNDAFVVIALGKDKFQTSIKEKATSSVEWREECELTIPSQGNTANLQLTVFHKNGLGIDEFLGQVQVPLAEFDVYERPRNTWHRLKGKPEKDKKKGEKERGELEIRVAFTVRSGSLLDITSKKEKNKSITSLKNLGGSLMSLGNKEKASIKNFAKSVSHKIDKIAHKPGKKKSRKESRDSQGFPQELMQSRQRAGDADPGVISDSDEDFGFDEEVTVNTRSSSPYSTVSRGSSVIQEQLDVDGLRFNSNNQMLSESRAPPKPIRIGGNATGLPSNALESPISPPSPPTPSHSQAPLSPTLQSPNPPLTFPNLTPINLATHNETHSPRNSASSDSAFALSLSSSINTKDTNSSASTASVSPEPAPRSDTFIQSSRNVNMIPEPAPRTKELIPNSPQKKEILGSKDAIPDSPTPNTSKQEVFPDLSNLDISKEEVILPESSKLKSPSKIFPESPKIKSKKKFFPDSPKLKSAKKDLFAESPKLKSTKKEIPQEQTQAPDSPSFLKPSRFFRSTSANESATLPSSSVSSSDQGLSVPPSKSRSISTTSTPTFSDQGSSSNTTVKEPITKKVTALQALASSSSKVILQEANPSPPPVPSPSCIRKNNSDLTLPSSTPSGHSGFNISAPPTPTTPSASVFSYGSSSATPSTPATPKGNSSGPSPATPISSSSRGTPGLAERPSAAVTRSGSLHEKPTAQPVIDEWERKLYGRNASE